MDFNYMEEHGLIDPSYADKMNKMSVADEEEFEKWCEEMNRELENDPNFMNCGMEDNKVIYAPWIPVTTASYINGVRVWDQRWWMNILCKINWFFHFKKRKAHKKYANTNVNTKFCHETRG